MSEGWIYLDRKLLDNWLWEKKPFSYGQAWIDLIFLANYERGEIWVRGMCLTIERGQVGYSARTLSKRWGWSMSKLKSFLTHLETRTQIRTQNNNISLCITITNYEAYQKKEHKKEHRRNTEGTQKEPIKEVKEVKEEKITTLSGKPDFMEVLEYLNQKTGKKFQPREGNLEFIKARLLDGMTVEILKKIIDLKVADKEFDRKYLRPATLFNATKCAQYEGEIGLNSNNTHSRMVRLNPATGQLEEILK